MPVKREHHVPTGDPCTKCGRAASLHIVYHHPKGDPCITCGLDAAKHVIKHHRTHSQASYYVGIDGEGQGDGTREGNHRYVMLAYANEEQSLKRSIEAPEGGQLSTVECLDFILSIPSRARVYAFAFGYDLTKILTDCPDRVIYHLLRPDTRQNPDPKRPPRAVKWNGYKLNWQAAKFSVSKGGQRRVIWDVFKFFQSKFTTALEDWFSKEGKQLPGTLFSSSKERIWDPPEMGPDIERMREMKLARANFDKVSRTQILEYCYSECGYMARLAHKLIDAHIEAGLKLTNYYGAGSSASAILKLLGIDKCNRETPKKIKTTPVRVDWRHGRSRKTGEVIDPVASSFFGGRFENRVLGPITKPVYSRDISSAYPYQLTFLPCLDCGKWELVRGEKGRAAVATATAALVHYGLDKPDPSQLPMHWGPFPFRLPTGAIAFPSHSGGGWVWRDEYLQGETHFPNVHFREAWIYRTECNHQPFARIPEFYLYRMRIGKEGPGIVVKLATNAVFGKLCQSLGRSPPFQCWIWAAMVTSGTRAQILEVLGMHRDRSNMLMTATDGIYSLEDMVMPKPRDTGTEHGINELGKLVNKPLGGWETKKIDRGVFIARPGIYFPMNPTVEDLKNIRGRGVGRSVIWDNWQTVVTRFAEGAKEIKLPNVERFIGAKSAIGMKYDDNDERVYVRHQREGKPLPRYGQWEVREVKLSFNPLPKREPEIMPDGSLSIRAFPELTSLPYKRTSIEKQMENAKEHPDMLDAETLSLALAAGDLLWQPDGENYSQYEPLP